MSDSGGSCTFRGHVESIRIEGLGPEVLTESAPFAGAARVVVDGARVGYAGLPSLTVERPDYLVPIGMNPRDAPYDITYRSGSPMIVDLVSGGSNGAVTGRVPDHTECASSKCDIVWAGASKRVSLYPADGRAVALAGPFPLVPDPLAPVKPFVREIVVEGATGEVTCEGSQNVEKLAHVRRVFRAGDRRMLSVGPLQLEDGRIGVEVLNEPPADWLSGGPVTAVEISAAPLLAATALVVVRSRRRRRTRLSAVDPGPGAAQADALIVTAVKDEYQAVLSVDTHALPGSSWEKRRGSTRLEVAFRNFATARGPLRIAVTQALDMGGVNATAAASLLIRDYGVKCLAMCGVCAGRRGEVELGDVLVADRLWQYDTGKLKAHFDDAGKRVEHVQGDIDMYRIEPPEWRQEAEHFEIDVRAPWLALRPNSYEAQGNWILERILNRHDPLTDPEQTTKCSDYSTVLARLWKKGLLADGRLDLTDAGRAHIQRVLTMGRNALPAPKPLRVHVGAIATGNRVMEDSELFAVLADDVRKVIGVEMEAAAIGALAHNEQLPYSVVMKAVMDHADADKSDNFKAFAARASAECLIAFLREHLPPKGAPGGP